MVWLYKTKQIPVYIDTPLSTLHIDLSYQEVTKRLNKLKDGDRSVIYDLCCCHIKLIIYIAGQYARTNRELGEDCVQACFVSMLLELNRISRNWREINNNLTGYLVAFFHNACRDTLRQGNLVYIPLNPTQRTPNRTKLSDVQQPQKASRDDIDACLQSIEEELIVEYKIQGFNNREIAEILNCAEGSVRYHLKKIKERYEESQILESERD